MATLGRFSRHLPLKHMGSAKSFILNRVFPRVLVSYFKGGRRKAIDLVPTHAVLRLNATVRKTTLMYLL